MTKKSMILLGTGGIIGVGLIAGIAAASVSLHQSNLKNSQREQPGYYQSKLFDIKPVEITSAQRQNYIDSVAISQSLTTNVDLSFKNLKSNTNYQVSYANASGAYSTVAFTSTATSTGKVTIPNFAYGDTYSVRLAEAATPTTYLMQTTLKYKTEAPIVKVVTSQNSAVVTVTNLDIYAGVPDTKIQLEYKIKNNQASNIAQGGPFDIALDKSGFETSLTNLLPNTEYSYELTKGENKEVIASGTFRTQALSS